MSGINYYDFRKEYDFFTPKIGYIISIQMQDRGSACVCIFEYQQKEVS